LQVFGRKTRFLGEWLGLEKPGFYGDLGLFASIWEKNPVSGWVAGVGETGFLWGFRIVCKYLGEKPGFWVSGWGSGIDFCLPPRPDPP